MKTPGGNRASSKAQSKFRPNRTRRRRQAQPGIPQDTAAWMAFVRLAARGGK
jgi:hypothetical protein